MISWLGSVLSLVILILTWTPVKASNEACVVSSNGTVSKPWSWPRHAISVWVPPGLPSGSNFLQIQIYFKDHPRNISYNTIQLQAHKILFRKERKGSTALDTSTLHLNETELGGWLNITFEASKLYLLYRTGTNELLLQEPKNYYLDIEEVFISASNLTLNCDSNELIWNVTNSTKVITPLSPTDEYWKISFYGDAECLPLMTLGNDTFTVGTGETEGAIALNTTVSLEQRTYYSLFLECSTTALAAFSATCQIKFESTILQTFNLSSRPSVLEFSASEGKPFFLIMETNLHKSGGSVPTITGGYGVGWMVSTLILIGLILISVVAFLVLIFRGQKKDLLIPASH